MSPSAKLVQGSSSKPSASRHQQVFFAQSATLSPMIDSVSGFSSIVEKFSSTAATFRKGEPGSPSKSLKRKGSTYSVADGRTFAFSLPLPHKAPAGDELPPTLTSSALMDAGVRGHSAVERVEVSYRLVVTWDPHDEGDEHAMYVQCLTSQLYPCR